MQSRYSALATVMIVALLIAPVSFLRAESAIELRVNAGDTIEIGTDSAGQKPEFSWILTKDRKFQNAQRNRFFQTRFVQAGTYILDVSTHDPGGSTNDYRAFTIIVADQPSTSPTLNPAYSEGNSLQAVLQSTSPIVDGKIYVPTEGGLIQIDPSQSTGKISSYDIDVDSTIDSDGDGNPTNDKDTIDSLSAKIGSPIYLYVVPKTAQRTITLTVSSLSNPVPSTTQLQIAYGQAPIVSSTQSQSSPGAITIQNAGSSIVIQKVGNTVRFESKLDASVTTGKELLYEWDFGDRSKSLLTNPSHTYASNGSYTISLTVRDIARSSVITTETASITVDGTTPLASSSSASSVASSVSSHSNSSKASSASSSSGSLGAILWVGGIIVVLFILFASLVGIILFIKSKFTGKLQNTLEKMEQTIVQKDEKQQILETKTEPMKLKKSEGEKEAGKEAVIDREKSKPDMKTASVRTNETPMTTSGPVPSWLAKSPSTPPSPIQNTPAQTTESKPQASVPVQASVPPNPVTQPKPASASSPTPDWLKPSTPGGSGTPTPPTPPASTNGPVPAWLEKKPEAPVTKPTPTATTIPTTTQSTPQATATISSPPRTIAPAPVVTPTPVTQVKDAIPPVPKPPEQKPTVAPIAQPVASVASIAPAPVTAPTPAPTVKVSSPTPVKTAPQPQGSVTLTASETSTKGTPVETKEKNDVATNVVADSQKTEPTVPAKQSDDDEPVVFIQADSLTKDA